MAEPRTDAPRTDARKVFPEQRVAPTRRWRGSGRYAPLTPGWPGTGRYTVVCRASGLQYRPAGAPGSCPTCGKVLDA